MSPPPPSGPRYDNFIQAQKVRVIDENGENLGVMYTREAMEQANDIGLNLVEISPNADPPVAKFLDIGRHKYEAQKKANAKRKKYREDDEIEALYGMYKATNEDDDELADAVNMTAADLDSDTMTCNVLYDRSLFVPFFPVAAADAPPRCPLPCRPA